MRLKWTKSENEDGNTIYEAPGPWRDLPARWRIEPLLRGNRKVWFMTARCDGFGDGWEHDAYPNVGMIKAAIELVHRTILEQAEKS